MDTLAFTVIAFPLQRSLLMREYKNGNYSLPSFYMSTMLSMNMLRWDTAGCIFVFNTEAFVSIVEVCAIALPVYFMVKLQTDFMKFLFFFLILVSLTWIGKEHI